MPVRALRAFVTIYCLDKKILLANEMMLKTLGPTTRPQEYRYIDKEKNITQTLIPYSSVFQLNDAEVCPKSVTFCSKLLAVCTVS
uniref:Putative ovule protein n=1 Tax=Solanum chacoense TaxID=4108 RepID=A0A0V0GXX4_SOLCH